MCPENLIPIGSFVLSILEILNCPNVRLETVNKDIKSLNFILQLRFVWALQATTGLCAGVALEFRPPVTAARIFTKDKYLEPMFGDAGQARTKAAMLILMIDTTSSRSCTKPIVVRRFLFIPSI